MKPNTTRSYFPTVRPSAKPRRTVLHELLAGKTVWDELTWAKAERYLSQNTSRYSMYIIAEFAGADTSRTYFKTDLIQLLRGLPPQQVLAAWKQWRRDP